MLSILTALPLYLIGYADVAQPPELPVREHHDPARGITTLSVDLGRVRSRLESFTEVSLTQE